MTSGGGGEVARFYATLGINSSGFDSGIASAISTMGRGALAGVGLSVGLLGVQGAIAGITGAIGGSMGNVMSYESAIAQVQKVAQLSKPELAGLSDEIKSMSTRIPVSRDALADIAKVAAQLGVTGTSNISKFTETVAQMSVAAEMAPEEVATSLGRLSNLMQRPIGEADKLASAIFGVASAGASTEREITEFSLRIAGSAQIVGASNAYVLALSGTLASLGDNAEAGGTAVQRSFMKINEAVISGGADLDLLAATAGVSSAAFAKAWKDDAGSAFTQFLAGLGKSGDAAGSILKALGLDSQRTQTSLLKLSQNTDTLDQQLKVANDTIKDSDRLTTAYGNVADTTASRVQIFKNNIVDLADEIGGPLVGALNTVLPLMTEMVRVMKEGANIPVRANVVTPNLNGAGLWDRIVAGLVLGGLSDAPSAQTNLLGGAIDGRYTGTIDDKTEEALIRGDISHRVPNAIADTGMTAEQKRLRDLANQQAAGAHKADPLKQAWDSITDKLTGDVAAAYAKGGEKQVAIVRASQDGIIERIQVGADYLVRTLGVDMPSAVQAFGASTLARQQELQQAEQAMHDAFAAERLAAFFNNHMQVRGIDTEMIGDHEAAAKAIASNLIKTFGIDVPDAMTAATQQVIKAAQAMDQAVQTATDNIRKNTMTLAAQLWANINPNARHTEDANGNVTGRSGAEQAAEMLRLAQQASANDAQAAAAKAANDYGNATGDWAGAAAKVAAAARAITIEVNGAQDPLVTAQVVKEVLQTEMGIGAAQAGVN